MKLSIIIPVYNEEQTLKNVVEIVKSVKLPKEYTAKEIILVDALDEAERS